MVTVESRSTLKRTGQLARDLWEISRPGIFFVSLVPFYLGYLLAGREFLGPNILGLLVGFVIWGPLVWLAVLAINDAYDYEGDLLNPRKNTPLTTGRLSVRGAIIAAYGAVAISLAISYAIRPGAALATLGFVVCGWIYSVPPLKCKNRPGLDILSNCIALGVFPVLGGWAVVEPLSEFPWIAAVAVFLIEIALYTPTMIPDIDSDRESGYTTTAVVFGAERTYQIGLISWSGYWVLSIVMAAQGHMFPGWMVWFQVACAPLFIWLYHRYLAKAREPKDIGRGMLLVGKLFLLPSLVFALGYTNVL